MVDKILELLGTLRTFACAQVADKQKTEITGNTGNAYCPGEMSSCAERVLSFSREEAQFYCGG